MRGRDRANYCLYEEIFEKDNELFERDNRRYVDFIDFKDRLQFVENLLYFARHTLSIVLDAIAQ